MTSVRPVASSTHLETSTTHPEPFDLLSSPLLSFFLRESDGLEISHPRPWASRRHAETARPRRSMPSGLLRRRLSFPPANPRPEGNFLDTDADKENVCCHACGNDDEDSVVGCACGHYYCNECLGQMIKSSVCGDSPPFPPLCCGKPVPVDVNSTVLDKDVLRAFMEKKLGLPLSGLTNRAAQILPPAAKGTAASGSVNDFDRSLAGKTPGP